jgi:hypothetical protein
MVKIIFKQTDKIMDLNKKIDFLVVLLLLAVTASAWFFLDLKPMVGGIFFTFIPSFYLIIRKKKNFKKIFLAVLAFGILVGLAFDFLETISQAWVVPRIFLPWRLFGVWPVDNLLGYIEMTLLMVVFYEHFLDDEKRKKISKKIFLGLLGLSLAVIIIWGLFILNPASLNISYAYLKGGLVAIILPIILGWWKPKLIPKFLAMAAFFFPVWLTAEVIALKTGGWIFPGQYLGLVEIFNVKFPFEELFFWMLSYAAVLTAYYEFFIDDLK